jgi:uncharacterized membrane protein (GlpM family)
LNYFIKGCIGALVVVLLAFLTKTRFSYLAGLAPLFKRMFNLAVKWGLLEKSPAASLDKFK